MLFSVAPYLFVVDRTVSDGFKFNKETEFVPIAGLVENELNSEKPVVNESGASSIQNKHHSALLALLSEELSVSPEEIHDIEL